MWLCHSEVTEEWFQRQETCERALWASACRDTAAQAMLPPPHPLSTHQHRSDLGLNTDLTPLPIDDQGRTGHRHSSGDRFRGTITRHFATKHSFKRVLLEKVLLSGDNQQHLQKLQYYSGFQSVSVSRTEKNHPQWGHRLCNYLQLTVQ